MSRRANPKGRHRRQVLARAKLGNRRHAGAIVAVLLAVGAHAEGCCRVCPSQASRRPDMGIDAACCGDACALQQVRDPGKKAPLAVANEGPSSWPPNRTRAVRRNSTAIYRNPKAWARATGHATRNFFPRPLFATYSTKRAKPDTGSRAAASAFAMGLGGEGHGAIFSACSADNSGGGKGTGRRVARSTYTCTKRPTAAASSASSAYRPSS